VGGGGGEQQTGDEGETAHGQLRSSD
jgi:hypothetical protein